MNERFVNLYQSWVIGRPKFTLAFILLLTIGLAFGLPNFKLDASADSLTLENDTDLDYFREITKRYSSGDFLVVTYKPTVDLFSDESIATLKALRNELAAVDGVTSVMSMLDAPLLYSPRVSLAGVTDTPRTLLTEDTDRDLAKQEFLTSPIYREMLLGPDGQTTALLANLAIDHKYIELVRHRDTLRLKRTQQGLTPAETQELEQVSKAFLDYRTAAAVKSHERVAQVRSIVASYKDQAQIFLGGGTMITADMIDFIRSDLVVFGTGIILFIIATLAFIFRQWRFVILPLVTSVLAVIMMLGFLSWIDWRLTVISSNFVALLLIISLAISIHLVVRFREYHAGNPGWSQRQLVWSTVHTMFRPCLYTALTTMVAFVSLVVSGIRPVIDFGWMMTIGLGVALILSFVLLPAGLMVWPLGSAKDEGDNSAAITLRFSRFTERHGGVVFWASTLVACLSIYGMSKLEVENRFIDFLLPACSYRKCLNRPPACLPRTPHHHGADPVICLVTGRFDGVAAR